VKELFEKPAPRTVRRTRQQLQQSIDADYYGLRDEEDGVLERVEAVAEAAMLAQARARWEAAQAERLSAGGLVASAVHEADAFVAHVPLPEKAAIEALVVERKKRGLLAKYQSVELASEEEAARRGTTF